MAKNRKEILFIEDNPVTQIIVFSLLKKAIPNSKYEIKHYDTVDDGLMHIGFDMIEQKWKKPNLPVLVISDDHTPSNYQGEDLYHMLKEKVPFIFMSAAVDLDEKVKKMGIERSWVINKGDPNGMDKFAEIVSKALEQAELKQKFRIGSKGNGIGLSGSH